MGSEAELKYPGVSSQTAHVKFNYPENINKGGGCSSSWNEFGEIH
jgi:hypothetical protein